MIKTATQLKAKIRNLSGGDSLKSRVQKRLWKNMNMLDYVLC